MNNDPNKNIDYKFKVLNQLIAAQSMLHVFPNDEKLGEFIAQALIDIPAIEGCAICLRTCSCVKDMPDSEFSIITETLKNIPDNQDHFSISIQKKENRYIFSIKTVERSFGYLFLSAKNYGGFEIFKPAINNFINMVAMNLENQWQKKQLINHKLHLEELVDDRTTELKTEIAERKQSEDSLLKNQYSLYKIQEIGNIGGWELDIQNNILKWTDKVYKIFGLPLGTEINLNLFMNCIHPDDRDYVNKKRNVRLRKEPYDIEHRIIVNNKVKWVREKADIEFDAESKPVKAIGFVQDITERKQVEEELAKYREHLEKLVKERTIELDDNIKELKRLNKLFVGREFRIKELRDRLKELEGKN